MAPIAVIIVNYNSAELCLGAVRSVFASEGLEATPDVHVVDNASPEGDGQVLEEAFARDFPNQPVTLYREPENHGFARGNNVVLRALAGRATPPEFVFFLNPDALLTPDTLARMCEFMITQPNCALAGCRIDEPQTGSWAASAFRFPTASGEFAAAVNFGPITRRFADRLVSFDGVQPTCPVDWASGAACIARLEALEAVGFFEDAFFLYYEETDLMKRLWASGREVWHLDRTKVDHIVGASTGVKGTLVSNNKAPRYLYESWRIYFHRNHGRLYALYAASLRVCGWAMNCVLRALQGRRPDGVDGFFPAMVSVVIWPLLTGVSPDKPSHPT